MSNDLVTIVVPVYNVEKYLKRCVESLIKQSYSPVEILLIDDGSTDNSSKMCDTFANQYPNIKVIHQANGGSSSARNTGTANAQGKYICYVDSDDFCDLDMVRYLVYLKDKYKADMSVCGFRMVFENRKIIKETVFGDGKEECLNSHDCIRNMLYHKNVEISPCAKLYKTEIMRKISYPVGRKYEDVGTIYKTFMACECIACGYIPKYNYCLRPDSNTTEPFREKDFDILELADSMCKDVLSVYPDLKKAVIRYRVYTRFVIYNRMLKSHGFDKERASVIEFIKSHRKDILVDSYAPTRDRLAMLLFTVSRPLYAMMWRLTKK